MFAVYAGFRGLTASLPLALARSGVPGPAHGLQRFGSRIAFMSQVAEEGSEYDILVMDADGSDVKTGSCGACPPRRARTDAMSAVS